MSGFKRSSQASGLPSVTQNLYWNDRSEVATIQEFDYTQTEMIIYKGSIEDPTAVIQFLRHEAVHLRTLRKVIVSRGGTVIKDVNKDSMEFPGLTYGSKILEELLRELGVIFHPSATPRFGGYGRRH